MMFIKQFTTILLPMTLILSCAIDAHAAETSKKAPFASCASDGQQGLKAPLDQPQDAIIPDVPTSSGLVLYQAWGTPAVLGPRGWYCAGLEGSNGGTLILAPERYQPSDFMFRRKVVEGSAIEINFSFGGTSGRFTVAKTAARLFPRATTFVQSLIDNGLIDKSKLPTKTFPNDSLIYLDDFIVEYITPPHSDGEGTRGFLRKNANEISGVVIMDPAGDHDLVTLAIRLPASQSHLVSLIMANVEKRSNFR
jgi:hypothetical protein